LLERLLDRVQGLAFGGKAFECGQPVAAGLHGEHQAGADGAALEQHRAAAADAVLTADVGARQAEVVTQVVGEQPPRVLRVGQLDPVDDHEAITRATISRTRWSRKSGLHSGSELGDRPRVGSAGSASRGLVATPKRATRSPARAAPARAKSPCRRASSAIATGPRVAGDHVSVTSSSGASAGSIGPRKKS